MSTSFLRNRTPIGHDLESGNRHTVQGPRSATASARMSVSVPLWACTEAGLEDGLRPVYLYELSCASINCFSSPLVSSNRTPAS